MNKIIITTDSGVDPVNTDYMVPGLLLRNDGQSFKDVFEIDSREIIKQKDAGALFKTSAPTYTDYVNVFKKARENSEDVIHLSMGYGISQASVNQSLNISKEVDERHISVIDSCSGATGGTLLYLYLNYLVQEGCNKEEIIHKVDLFKKYVQTSFFVNNPVGFKQSGRDKSEMCMKEKAILLGAQALKIAGIKFRVDFNESGNLFVKSKMMGRTSDKGFEMIKSIVNDSTIDNYDKRIAVIGTVLEQDLDMDKIEKYLNNYFEKVVRQDINGVVAAYGSKDLVGLSLVRKNNIM